MEKLKATPYKFKTGCSKKAELPPTYIRAGATHQRRNTVCCSSTSHVDVGTVLARRLHDRYVWPAVMVGNCFRQNLDCVLVVGSGKALQLQLVETRKDAEQFTFHPGLSLPPCFDDKQLLAVQPFYLRPQCLRGKQSRLDE